MTEIDQIIDGVIAPEDIRESTPLVSNETENLRERLIGVAVAGKSKEYLGKSITSDEIGSLDQKELRKLYARYEAHIGGVVTNTMKKHFVTAYINLVELSLPKNLVIVDREGLEESLNRGLFIELGLSKLTCSLYHRFGHLLAPVESVLLTSNHLKKVPAPSDSLDIAPTVDILPKVEGAVDSVVVDSPSTDN